MVKKSQSAPKKPAPKPAPKPSQVSASKKQELPEVHMKCRRGGDQATRGQTCKGMRAYKLSADGAPVAQFRCTECRHVWSVALGGPVNL